MTLVDRYFETLRVFLPGDDHADVIRELREDIDERVSEQEAALGRRLQEAEEAAVLKPLGHPLLLASRYRPQRHLIGPLVFPYYWLALRVALVLFTIVHLLDAGVDGLVVRLLGIVGWFTLMAAAAEHWLRTSDALSRWDPIRLARQEFPVSRVERLLRREPMSRTGLAVGVVLSAWWLVGLKNPVLILGDGAELMTFGPVVHQAYPFIVLFQLAFLALHAGLVFWPRTIDSLDRSFLVTSLRVTVAGTFIGFVAFGSHDYIVATDAGGRPMIAAFVNQLITYVLVVAAVLAMLTTAHDFVRRVWGQATA